LSLSSVDRLAALLAPRTVSVLPRRGSRHVLVGPRCRSRSSGEVDVAVLTGRARIPDRAGAVLALFEAVGDRPQRRGDQLVLGPGAGLWTANLRAGIVGAGKADRGGWLLLCQGCGVAEQVLRAAATRGFPIRAALTTGTGRTSVLRLAQIAAELRPAVGLLLALHRPCGFPEWLALARQQPRAVLLLADSAEPLAQLLGPPRGPLPSASHLCRSLGFPVTRSPEELVAAGALLDAGVRRETGLVLGLAPRIDEGALLADALGRSGLRSDGGAAVAAVVRARGAAPKKLLSGADAAVVIAASGEPPWILSRHSRSRVRADAEALRALAAVLEPAEAWNAEQESGSAKQPRSARARRARLLLDGWPAELTEVEVKTLLGVFGLRAPAERLVSSASAAAQAAAAVGAPVAVKPVGAELVQRAAIGAIRLGVEGGAAVRQAFRDVLDVCARIKPSPPLAGVLVSQMVALPFALEVSLLWPAGAPPVLFAGRRREDDEVVGLMCPVTAAQATWASARLLGARCDAAVRDRLAVWLQQLSSLTPDLAGRMRWLRLDTVSPPTKTSPPLILDGAALQTASLRDPQGLDGGEPLDA